VALLVSASGADIRGATHRSNQDFPHFLRTVPKSDSLDPVEGVTLLTYVILIVLIVVVAALYMRVRSRKVKG
jgi:hypothetical protein